jgi:hypothetical protein
MKPCLCRWSDRPLFLTGRVVSAMYANCTVAYKGKEVGKVVQDAAARCQGLIFLNLGMPAIAAQRVTSSPAMCQNVSTRLGSKQVPGNFVQGSMNKWIPAHEQNPRGELSICVEVLRVCTYPHPLCVKNCRCRWNTLPRKGCTIFQGPRQLATAVDSS